MFQKDLKKVLKFWDKVLKNTKKKTNTLKISLLVAKYLVILQRNKEFRSIYIKEYL